MNTELSSAEGPPYAQRFANGPHTLWQGNYASFQEKLRNRLRGEKPLLKFEIHAQYWTHGVDALWQDTCMSGWG